MPSASRNHVDFFVSYNHADEDWATWIAWQLEQAGFSVTIQAWDFRPGNNFVLAMQEAAAKSDRTIMVLSEHYLASNFTQPEWAAAFAQDPRGEHSRLVPVRVAPCNLEGLPAQIIYIDLVGKDVRDAAAALLAGVSPGRAKPTTPPPFPGATGRQQATTPTAPTPASPAVSLDWRPLGSVVSLRWRTDLAGVHWGSPRSGPPILEVHLMPTVASARVEVRRLRQLGNELADLGRANGVFTVTQQLNVQADAALAVAETVVQRDVVDTGLVVTREGQRGAWVSLPTDGLGSVFDPVEAQPRIEALLKTLLQIDIAEPERFTVTAGLARPMMLVFGSSEVVGRRNSASMRLNDQDIRVLPDDDLSVEALRANTADVAEELVARLMAQAG